MKILTLLLSFFALSAFAQNPIVRGPGTTNTPAAWTNVVRFTVAPLTNKLDTDLRAALAQTNATLYASNIVSGGQLPLGTVSTGLSAQAGPFLTTNGAARSYSYNGVLFTNLDAGGTNKTISGATFVGASTNAPGAKLTGGFSWTNFSTGTWMTYTNGVLTMGPTNAPANVTLSSVGTIASSGNINGGNIISAAGVYAGSAAPISYNVRSSIASPSDGTLSFYATTPNNAFSTLFLGGGSSLATISTNWPALRAIGTNNVGLELRRGTNVAAGVYADLTAGNGTFAGLVQATNSVASYATTAGVSLQATGITNTFTGNATAYVTATAVAFTIKDRTAATLYTSPTLTATLPVTLQPGWSVNAASGLAGTMLPW
jgi:hypothetical protein